MLKANMKINFSWKIWLLIIVLFFSLLSIFGLPPTFFQKGVLVTSVEINSTAFNQGFREGQIITSIDSQKVDSLNDFSNILQGKFISNESIKTIFVAGNSEIIFFSDQPPKITISDIPKTNVKLGLDLVGGSRALIQAEDRKLSKSEASELVDITENRLNEFGLTDLTVRQVSDLAGKINFHVCF